MYHDTYIAFLSFLGDPVEREAIHKHHLTNDFPRYAEFWFNYVWPNRDPQDSSKLRNGFPVEIEDIFNNHYYVLYQLNTALKQIAALSNSILDVADPFYHVATAIDLVERTFVAAFVIKYGSTETQVFKQFGSDEFKQFVDKFWQKDYSKQYEKFKSRYRPVNLSFHNVSDIFSTQLPKKRRKEFQLISSKIRQYRNILTHSLPPLKLVKQENSVKFLPRPSKLAKYSDGRWSSGLLTIDYNDYEPAEAILYEMSHKLVVAINDLWEVLIEVMDEIRSRDIYSDKFKSPESLFNNTPSGDYSYKQDTNNTGGTAIYTPDDWDNSPK